MPYCHITRLIALQKTFRNPDNGYSLNSPLGWLIIN